jgi:hypothetical protein
MRPNPAPLPNLFLWCGLQAQRHADAARLLLDKVEALKAARSPPLRLKKLYVLAALEVEAFREAALRGAPAPGAARPLGDAGGGGGGGGAAASKPASASAAATAEALAALMGDEAAGARTKGFDGAWRGAEAHHFWLLAHRQLYGGRVRERLGAGSNHRGNGAARCFFAPFHSLGVPASAMHSPARPHPHRRALCARTPAGRRRAAHRAHAACLHRRAGAH